MLSLVGKKKKKSGRQSSIQFRSGQSFSHVSFCNLWTAAHQASVSIINSESTLKLLSTKLVMPSDHLILCHPLLLAPSIFPINRSFPVGQFFASHGQSIRVSASTSVLPMKGMELVYSFFPIIWLHQNFFSFHPFSLLQTIWQWILYRLPAIHDHKFLHGIILNRIVGL